MKNKVVVAMSGGVDSSVVASVLKDQGWEVIGVTLSLFKEERERPSCCGAFSAAAKARSVCQKLGIRHYVKNASAVFKERVIDNFVQSYLSGSTPNPCVECNRWVKFDYLFEIALSMDAQYLATGHYARIMEVPAGFALLRGLDPLKDQSYFLYCLKKEQLGRLLFPLGGLAKKDVRKLAQAAGLPTAADAESNDICFVGEGNYDTYLKRRASVRPRPGRIVDVAGKTLGEHTGFFNYTVGQRKGLGIAGAERLYVVELRPDANEVVVGTKAQACYNGFEVSGLNWLVEKPEAGARLEAQIRYRHEPAACELTEISGGRAVCVLDKAQFAPTRGQSVVFYEGERVLGGGVIDKVFNK